MIFVFKIVYIIFVVLVIDFGVFLVYYFLYKILVFWEFYKVYYLVEGLNFIIGFRYYLIDIGLK